MKIIKNKFRNELNLRTQKDYPIPGIEFIDIMPLIIQKETLNEMIEKFVEELKDKDIDYIVVPEARGFLLGVAIANKLGLGCIPIRKKGKLPPVAVERQFEYEKEYGKDTLELPRLINESYENKKIYIIDDIYATGNTMKAIEKSIKDSGGTVVGKGVIMNIIELNKDEDIFSLIEINEN